MSKFKGYAQSSGFKNIQLPDTSRKIREEGQRTIRQMQATFDAKQANSKAVINALNDKYRVEEQNRQFVFDLETENRNQIRARMVENNKTINENNQTELRKSQQTYRALADLAPTLGKVAMKLEERADESGKKKGEELANTIALAGGSYADIQYIRDLDKAHIANDEKYRNIVKRLIENGASNDIINQIRNANSSVTYGLQKTMLVNAALDYPEALSQFETLPLLLADGTEGEITLGQARTMGDQYKDLVEAQQLRNRSDYIAQFQGKEDDPMVARYLYPKMIEAERANARGQAAEKLRRIQREDELQHREGFRTRFFDADGHASNLNFLAKSKYPRSDRQTMLKVYAEMAREGLWGSGPEAYDKLDELKTSPVTLKDQEAKPFGSLYKGDSGLYEIRAAIEAYDQETKTFKAREEQARKQRMQDDLLKFVVGLKEGSFDNNYSKELIAEAREMGLDTSDVQAVLSNRSSDAVQRRVLIPLLDEKVKNRTLKPADLDGITDQVILDRYQPYIEAIIEEAAAMPLNNEDVEKALSDELRKVLGDADYEKVLDTGFKYALADAQKLYNSNLGAPDPTSDPAARQRNALDAVVARIENQTEGSLFYVVNKGVSSDNAYFAKFDPASSEYIRPELGRPPAEILELVRDDNDYVLNSPVMSEGKARELATQIKSGKPYMIPTYIHQLADVTGYPAYEIINHQLHLQGIKDAKAEPTLVDNIRSSLSETPEIFSIFNTPSAQNINSVVSLTGNKVPFVRKDADGFTDIVTLARSQKVKGAHVIAAMWANETGWGKEVHGSNALFNIKADNRWKGDFTKTAHGNYRNYDTPAQAVADFPKFIASSGFYPLFEKATTPREMIYALTEGANKRYAEDTDYATKIENILRSQGVDLDQPFIEYDGPPTRDPNYSSKTIQHVYNVHSLGRNSSGPHLDMKQVDNPNTPEDETGAYYEYNDPEIREYIFVDDQELGMVPLPDVPMTGNWESHTVRGSNGYDYGIHDGRGIYINPPAKVVNSFRTSEGDDMMIIELPSGRRFKFHHGRSVL